jgi:hypothetical protein
MNRNKNNNKWIYIVWIGWVMLIYGIILVLIVLANETGIDDSVSMKNIKTP